MASAAAAEAVLLLAVSFLLPLRLLSVALRLRLSPSLAPRRRARSAGALLTIAALLTAIYAVSDADSRPAADTVRSEIDELWLKVARLESLLEENAKTLKSKANILEEDSKLIETMEHDIQLLMNGQESIKKYQSKSYPESNIKAMEGEVQLLQQEVRKINNNAYTIESLANDAERRVESLSSEVKRIEGIIAEQWIQIRQSEQAFVLTKIMTSKVHESRSSETAYRWPGKGIVLKYIGNVDLHGIFLTGASYTRSCLSHTYKHCRSFIQAMNRCYHEASRFRKAIRHQYIPDIDRPNVFFLGRSISRSCISLPYNQFKISMSSAQKFHHKVQVFLQEAMRSNRYSRGLANELITFCLAYFVVISPMWIAWSLYSMLFDSKK